MPTTKETLVDWLKDAHAMESSIETMLSKQVDQLKDNPTVQSRVKEHLEITRQQKEKVGNLVKGLGGDVSTVKDTTMKLMSNVQQMMTGVAPDETVKSMIGNFAAEHFEIASYRSLIAGAEHVGEAEVARVCREILEQEEEMAEWLRNKIPDVTTGYLAKKVEAK